MECWTSWPHSNGSNRTLGPSGSSHSAKNSIKCGLKLVNTGYFFSGNPGQITVMGQQAGGASVHYHLLSPLARGLFNR